MNKFRFLLSGGVVVWIGVSLAAQRSAVQTAAPTRPPARTTNADPRTTNQEPRTTNDQNAVLKRYCVGCHSDKLKTHGLTLEHFD
ncbi:MAG TPA: hypothetical protein VGY57_14495, partial [Vicinamibacterales bacterium]|nr:hypothetical protein [Vicinamibacterales bacterium]